MASSRSFLSHWFKKFQQKQTSKNPCQDKQSALAASNLCANPTSQLKRGNQHAGWRNIGGKEIFFRSKWECNYCRYLQYLKEKGKIAGWEHEPKTFWFESIKRGVRSYLPDFRVLRFDQTIYWVEVKGYMDSKSKTKLTRFKRYYPNEQMELVTGTWFKANNAIMRNLIKDWE